MRQRFLLTAVLSTGLPVLAGGGSPPPRCRCAQVTLERYFEQAEIVVVARVRSVRTAGASAEGAERFEVEVTPLFRPEGPFKGSLEGVVLATSTSPAACGVPVRPGQDYVIFASRGDPGNPRLARFDSCSGSRPYPGNTDPGGELFLGLPTRLVLPRLFELAGAPPAQSPTGEFHTSPACWAGPRIYHQGTLPGPLQPPVRITRIPGPFPDAEGVRSPNGAYRAWTAPPPERATAGDAAIVLVDVERPTLLRIEVTSVQTAPVLTWVSEKLLFFRVAHGRVQFTDVLIDVELGRPVYTEAARYGDGAFAQYQQACLGQCPCLAVPGSADSLAAPPRVAGRPAEEAVLRRLSPNTLAYLDADWDGRIFTEAGGRRFTVSQLKGTTGREEYPITLEQVEFTGGAWWLRVALYAEHPCVVPDAAPIHRGWVPAFSRGGFLVAGRWPGGC